MRSASLLPGLVFAAALGASLPEAHAQRTDDTQGQGAAWSETFDPGALSGLLPDDTLGIQLFETSGAPEVTEAAAALSAALARAYPNVLTNTEQGSGDGADPARPMTGIPDRSVAATIAFEAPDSGGSPRVVVRFFDSGGARLSTLFARPGQRATIRVAGPGSAESQYERSRLIWGTDDQGVGTVFEGVSRRPLSKADFLERVGRHDLAEEATHHHPPPDYGSNMIVGGIVSGLACVGVGTVVIVTASSGSNSGCSTAACSTQHDKAESDQTAAAVILLSAGPWLLAGLVTAGAMRSFGDGDPAPESPSVADQRSLVRDYNQRLRLRLGLPSDEESATEPRPQTAPSLLTRWSPRPAAGGVGISF